MVHDHYKNLGFETASTENIWKLDVANYEMKNNHINKM